MDELTLPTDYTKFTKKRITITQLEWDTKYIKLREKHNSIRARQLMNDVYITEDEYCEEGF